MFFILSALFVIVMLLFFI